MGQLALGIKEYETKIKGLHAEWNYQLNNKDHGGMTTLDHASASPPPSNSNSNKNEKKNEANQNPFIYNFQSYQPPMNAATATAAPFSSNNAMMGGSFIPQLMPSNNNNDNQNGNGNDNDKGN